MIALELASRLGPGLGVSSLEELWAEIEEVSPLHAGVTAALLTSRQGRNGVVVPLEAGAGSRERAEVPPPLDPMADPGIASAEIHPAPPVPLSVAGNGVGRANAPGAGPEELQSPRPRAGAATAAATPTGSCEHRSICLACPAAGTGAGGTAVPGGGVTLSVRLVASRPMWDGGVLVQRSPSLAALHPPLALAVNPADLDRLGAGPDKKVRVSTGRGTIVVVAVADAAVLPGTAVLPFNLPAGDSGTLIDASAPYTELTVEHVRGPIDAAAVSTGGPVFNKGIDLVVWLIVLVKLVAVFVLVMISVIFMIMYERKAIARLGNRWGPNRAARGGCRPWPTAPSWPSRKGSCPRVRTSSFTWRRR